MDQYKSKEQKNDQRKFYRCLSFLLSEHWHYLLKNIRS